jgi:hypothetical protein
MGLASAGAGASAASAWSRESGRHESHLMSSNHMSEISRTLEHVKTALISFGIAKAKEFLSQAVPGLDQHLSDAERRSHRHEYGSTEPARHFAESGAFAQESGGSQPSGSTNWESDMYRSSGQFTPSEQRGSADYYTGSRGSEKQGTSQQENRVPSHQG